MHSRLSSFDCPLAPPSTSLLARLFLLRLFSRSHHLLPFCTLPQPARPREALAAPSPPPHARPSPATRIGSSAPPLLLASGWTMATLQVGLLGHRLAVTNQNSHQPRIPRLSGYPPDLLACRGQALPCPIRCVPLTCFKPWDPSPPHHVAACTDQEGCSVSTAGSCLTTTGITKLVCTTADTAAGYHLEADGSTSFATGLKRAL